MKKEQYQAIKAYLRGLVQGTPWQGHVYTVGGCVRDDVMGAEIKDIDLCVSLPGGGIGFARWLHDGGHTLGGVVTYPSYGTAMLHLKQFPDVELEFVQTRKEKYTDSSSRNPVTVFGGLEDDCMRRDLTINSLYCNISTDEIVDITGWGLADIRGRVIRTPASPDITYDDDPLRILRCIRFASRYGWQIDTQTFSGMLRHVHRLSIITRERVRDELDKMLTCAHPVMALELLRSTGAMHYVIPELEATYDMTQNAYHFGTVWQHTLRVVELLDSDRLELRMAALLHDIGKLQTRTEHDGRVHFLKHELAGADMVDGILRSLKYSGSFIRQVQFLVRYHMHCKAWGPDCGHMRDKRLRKLQYMCSSETCFRDLMTLVDADNRSHAPEACMPRQVQLILARTSDMLADGSAMFGYRLPLSGADVMDIKGVPPGPPVKDCLGYLLKVAFADPLRDRAYFVKQLKGYHPHE